MLKRTFGLCVLLCGVAVAEDAEPQLLWSTKIAGLQQGSAAVADGQVFAPVLGGTSVVSLDAASGKVRWTRPLADTSPYPPIIDKDSVYVITGSCTLYKLSRADGKVAWSRWLSSSISSMPTLSGGRVYAAAHDTPGRSGRMGGWHLVCLDAAKGKELWAAKIGNDILGAPLVDKGQAIVCTQDGDIHAFDIEKGKALWKADTSSSSMPVPCRDWLVYRWGAGLAAVKRADGTAAWNWEGKGHDTQPQAARPFLFPMIAGDRAFVALPGAQLECVDLTDRSTVWSWAGGEEVPGEPVMVAGRVYFGTSKGSVLSLSAKTGQTLWAVKTDATISDAPTIMDGTIYFHDLKGGVLAVDAATPEATGWSMWGGSPTHTGAMPRTQPENVVTPSAAEDPKK